MINSVNSPYHIIDVDTGDVAGFEPHGSFKATGSTNPEARGSLAITSDGSWTYIVNNAALSAYYYRSNKEGARRSLKLVLNSQD